MKKRALLKLFNFWPPFLGAGIRIEEMTPDLRRIRVGMRLSVFNRNYVGTHFGGSLYSMTDPFYMVMLIEALGPGVLVWDKSARIRYVRPGRGKVHADFELTDERVQAIRERLEREPKFEEVFMIEVRDERGEIVTEVEKTLSIRKKEPKNNV